MITLHIFERSKGRIVYIRDNAHPDYWDSVWDEQIKSKALQLPWYRSSVAKCTKKYLPQGASILEGGCGLAHHVCALQHAGYKAVGVDFAPKTIERVNKLLPDVDVQLGDVRNLNFADGSFDAYWSLGVIEHFWDGYDQVLDEMARVVKPGGYAFVTFPRMSPVRRLIAGCGGFDTVECFDQEPDGFYQFALPTQEVAAALEKRGFRVCERSSTGGSLGLSVHLPSACRLTVPNWLQTFRPIQLCRKAVMRGTDMLLNPLSGHGCRLVARKEQQVQ